MDHRHEYRHSDKKIMATMITRDCAPTSPRFSSQSSQTLSRSRWKRRSMPMLHPVLLILTLASLLSTTNAVFLNFDDCLERAILTGGIPYLKFTPMYYWAKFDTESPLHPLNIRVYGNVSGQENADDKLPPPGSPEWSSNETVGKINNIDPVNNRFTTLFANFQVLTYTSWASPSMEFCKTIQNGSCPLGPTFDGNASDPFTLPYISISHEFKSAYSFATWASTIQVVSGNEWATPLGCASATITPDIGDALSDGLAYVPAAILALVAIATVFAATCSPWGTSNLFRWTSNYGRDEDLLRLVTPGFGDCLQYIQFIVLAGSLSLNYPGFFQPVTSQASWSVLLFNQSFVSGGNGSQSLADGLYIVNGTYGLTRLGQYVGMTMERDIWACMAVFLLVVIAIVVVVIQLGFIGRWISRQVTKTQDGDLTARNWSFTAGNVVRIVFNFFMLPIISISLFQLVVSPRSSGGVVGAAVVLLILVAGIACWIFWFIFTTRPRAHLFDDLPTLLTYGPLYNTYSDDAAPFAFIPVLLNVIRGIAIGAIQPSGIAQIIILAICEVILILTLHAFRPFQSNTSMNAYHTFFSVVRLTCVLLMVAFVPSLSVSESSKGWIGYVILLLHAIVLVFGFFLNSLQTIIEVAARLCGIGADQRGGLVTVFGKRQLSKRNVHKQKRGSLHSNAAMLGHEETKTSQNMDSRSRSLSASSAVLLNDPYNRDSQRVSAGFDQFSGEYNANGTNPSTPGTNASPFTFLGGASNQTSRRPTMGSMGTALEGGDSYYRPPRPRKHTMDSIGPGAQGRPVVSADVADVPYSDNVDNEQGDFGEGPSRGSGTPAPAYLRTHRDDSDPNLERRNKTDYSVRESDFYYGLRGPALSSQPTRKLKTGPADPMSPVSTASSWFKSLNLLGGGRKKEKSKGFEVVRSTRMPPQMMAVDEEPDSPEVPQEPYRDSPESPPRNQSAHGVASAGALAGNRRLSFESTSDTTEGDNDRPRVSAIAPTLGPIETGGGIELPSRIGSRASRVSQAQGPPSRVPTIPRRNSRRTTSTENATIPGRLSTVIDTSAPPTPGYPSQHLRPAAPQMRLPFGSSDPSPSPERTPRQSAASSIYPNDEINVDYMPPPTMGTQDRPLSTGYVHQHTAQVNQQNDRYHPSNHLETSAEFIDRSRSGSTQRSGRSQGFI